MARAWKLAYSAKIGMRKLAPAGQNRAGSNKRLCWKMADESAEEAVKYRNCTHSKSYTETRIMSPRE